MRFLSLAFLLSALPAQAAQIYDIKPGKLEAFEFKFNACSAKCMKLSYSNELLCDAELKGALHLTLEGARTLVINSDYFTQTGSGASKAAACADASKGFFADETIRSYINALEAIRTSTPQYAERSHGHNRCTIPSVRVFRSPGVSPIDISEIEWIHTPIACPVP